MGSARNFHEEFSSNFAGCSTRNFPAILQRPPLLSGILQFAVGNLVPMRIFQGFAVGSTRSFVVGSIAIFCNLILGRCSLTHIAPCNTKSYDV